MRSTYKESLETKLTRYILGPESRAYGTSQARDYEHFMNKAMEQRAKDERRWEIIRPILAKNIGFVTLLAVDEPLGIIEGVGVLESLDQTDINDTTDLAVGTLLSIRQPSLARKSLHTSLQAIGKAVKTHESSTQDNGNGYRETRFFNSGLSVRERKISDLARFVTAQESEMPDQNKAIGHMFIVPKADVSNYGYNVADNGLMVLSHVGHIPDHIEWEKV